MASKVRGSRFRDELSEALKALRPCCWRYCFDNVGAQFHRCPRCFQPMKATSSLRPADLAAIYHGHAVVIEAKETTNEARLDFSRVEDHQRKALAAVEAAGGTALIAIRWNITRAPRAFVLTYSNFIALEKGIGRKSLPLPDDERPTPPAVLELTRARVRDDPGQGVPNPLVWDLRPVLNAQLRQHAWRLATDLNIPLEAIPLG